jgi:hypothetical protein
MAELGHFTDGVSRTWRIEINALTIRRCRLELQFAVERLPYDEALAARLEDPVLFMDLLECLTREQRERLQLSLEDFLRGFDNESVALGATKALLEAAILFIPPDRRSPILRAFGKTWSLQEQHNLRVAQQLNQLSDPQLESLIQTACGFTSMNAAASSDSVPTSPTPSENSTGRSGGATTGNTPD